MKKLLTMLFIMLASFSFAGQLDNISFKDTKGKIRSIKEYRGKKVYVKIWASGCNACMSSMPKLIELSEMKNRGYEVLTITIPGYYAEFPTYERFNKWFKSHSGLNNKFDVFVATDHNIVKKIKLRAFPYNLFINKNGEIEKEAPGVLSNILISDIMKKVK